MFIFGCRMPFASDHYYAGAPECVVGASYGDDINVRALRIAWQHPVRLVAKSGIVVTMALGGTGAFERRKGRTSFADAAIAGRIFVDLPGDVIDIRLQRHHRVLQVRIDQATLDAIAQEDHGRSCDYAAAAALDTTIQPDLLPWMVATLLGGRFEREECIRAVVATIIANGQPRRASSGLPPRTLRRVYDLVEASPGGVALADMAAAAGLSSFHFSREFRREVGLSPHRYIVRQKVLGAAALMATGDVPHQEVIERFGFSSASHMARAFRQSVGVPPQALRRAIP